MDSDIKKTVIFLVAVLTIMVLVIGALLLRLKENSDEFEQGLGVQQKPVVEAEPRVVHPIPGTRRRQDKFI